MMIFLKVEFAFFLVIGRGFAGFILEDAVKGGFGIKAAALGNGDKGEFRKCLNRNIRTINSYTFKPAGYSTVTLQSGRCTYPKIFPISSVIA